jgi:hypothetical protein
MFTAHQLATEGTFYLDEYADVEGPGYFGRFNWLVRGNDRVVSKYPPGASLIAAPFYLFFPDAPRTEMRFLDGEQNIQTMVQPYPSLIPAALAASITTAIAVVALCMTFRPFVGTRLAVLAAAVVGLGTGLWSVASDALWQHGPTAMWISLGMLGVARSRYVLGGLALAMAIVTRPQIAVIVAVLGLWEARSQRSWATLFRIGVPASFGLAAFFAFNFAVFGTPLQFDSGGYFLEGATQGSPVTTLLQVGQALIDPKRGLLFYTPVLAFLVPAIPSGWRDSPGWARGAAVGSVLYLFIQIRGNIWTGGDGFFGYRYPIETLVGVSALLVIGYQTWTSARHQMVRVTAIAAAASIAIHAFGAVI